MKKFFIMALRAICFIVGLSALSNELEIDFSVPVTYEKNEAVEDIIKTRTVTEKTVFNYGIELTDTVWLNKSAGLRASAAIAVPDSSTGTVDVYVNNQHKDYLSGKTEVKYADDTANEYGKMLFTLGLALNASSSRTGKVTVTPLVSFDYETVTNKNSGSKTELLYTGIGADLSAYLKASKNVYLGVSVLGAYEFNLKVNDQTNDSFKGRVLCAPKICLLYSF